MSGKFRRPAPGGRKSQKVGTSHFSKMTADEREEELSQFIESLGRSSPAKPVRPRTVEGEARRGARKARRLLAKNPTQEEIQAAWDIHSYEMELFDDDPADLAYHEAYLKVLLPRVR